MTEIERLREALEPCPFCGGEASFEAVTRPETLGAGTRWTVGCNETNEDSEGGVFEILCYGYQSLTTFATQREAAAAWNRRAALASTPPGAERGEEPQVNTGDPAPPSRDRASTEPVPVSALRASPAIADRLFDTVFAESELEHLLDRAGMEYESLGWDYYDSSIELHGVAPDARLSEATQRVIYDAGFSKAYVNHAYGWEAHYSFKRTEPFQVSKGWRVSYPHKRDHKADSSPGIWVEEVVPTWPKNWFETGYAIVKPAQGIVTVGEDPLGASGAKRVEPDSEADAPEQSGGSIPASEGEK